MVDDEYTPWLIEINSSPSMDYSTVYLAFYCDLIKKKAITKRLVKSCLTDTVKVIVDYTMDKKKYEKGTKIDVGMWKKIYKG